MTVLIFPLSRIEGHAQVSIEEVDGEVLSARFQATELRGFEHFVQGIPADQMPVIVPRICGVCATAHHVASVKALEDIYGVVPPPLAHKLRELLLLGQLIQNQATSLFIFTMPDRMGMSSLFDDGATSDSSDTARTRIAMHALRVRKSGTDLISAAGGQFIHPVKAVVGGMSGGIDAETASQVRQQLIQALPVACDLFDLYWEMSFELRERIGTWGDDQPAYYLAATGASYPTYDGDLLRVMGPDGMMRHSFQANEYNHYLTFHESESSYAGVSSWGGEVLRANSLARINLARMMGTPQADGYLTRFREAFGHPAHAILLFDLCRGIELVYAIERAIEMLDGPLDEGWAAVPHTPRDGEGYGLVEAPRGPLIHHYVIKDGLIAKAEFIIPTVHNMLAIERALIVAAKRYINSERVNLELDRAVGRVVRAFDPCISCATH
ncbi:MAG: F420-non-reducing hydrogenase large subunit [Chloroflexi bacterium]|nr:F420-non-reducing hydrogenase large subunit [Chloroflexota bacterium]